MESLFLLKLAYRLMPKGFAYVSYSNLQSIRSHIENTLGHDLEHLEETEIKDYKFTQEFVDKNIKKLGEKKKTLSEKLMGPFCFLVSEEDLNGVYEKFKDKRCEDGTRCGQGDVCATCLIKADFSHLLGTVKK